MKAVFRKENVMVSRVLGLASKQPVSSILNRCGPFSHRSYNSTAQKVANLLFKKPALSESECQMHNSKIPTYEQIKKSPELQQNLAKMYEDYATDPDFHEVTIESMKWGLKTLGREEL